MITSRIFTSETWLHALLHSALPLCWPSRTGKWFECVGLGKKKCQSNVNDDPIKKWFWFKLNNTNFSDFAIRSVSNFGSLFDFFFFFFFFSGSCGIFCNNFQFEGGWFFFFFKYWPKKSCSIQSPENVGLSFLIPVAHWFAGWCSVRGPY